MTKGSQPGVTVHKPAGLTLVYSFCDLALQTAMGYGVVTPGSFDQGM